MKNTQNMRSVFIIFTCLFMAVSSASAQNKKKTVDVVYLKDGTSHTGEIIIYEQGQELVLETQDGERITISDGDILRIVQGTTVEEVSEAKAPTEPVTYEARTSGVYNNTMLSFALGKGDGDALALGAGISTVVGYQIKPALGIGLGIGLDNYARRGETIYPVFAEVRAFLPSKKKPHTYHVSLAGGYGFAFARERIGVREAKGGYMIHPTIGYRTPTREGVDVNIDIGAKFQKAEFQKDLFNGDIRVRDLVFQRLTIRVGLTLWK